VRWTATNKAFSDITFAKDARTVTEKTRETNLQYGVLCQTRTGAACKIGAGKQTWLAGTRLSSSRRPLVIEGFA
jgi:hypothetical protein